MQRTTHHVETVIPEAAALRRSGRKAVLVTVIGVEGSSPRPVGSQLVVSETGYWVGQISSGCAEASIVEEAQRTLTDGMPRKVRYGRGSPYMDVTLPCGSGIDLYFDPMVPDRILFELEDRIHSRKPSIFAFNTSTTDAVDHRLEPIVADGPSPSAAWEHNCFRRPYIPEIRVEIFGRGTLLVALAAMAKSLGWDVSVGSPEDDILETISKLGVDTQHLDTTQCYSGEKIDRWTANILAFHDHEWEPDLLQKILRKSGFYVGVLGSRKTHAARCDALRDLQCSEEAIQRIKGPVGLNIGAITPPEIAASIIGEVIATHRTKPI